jgi:hypothetical protein
MAVAAGMNERSRPLQEHFSVTNDRRMFSMVSYRRIRYIDLGSMSHQRLGNGCMSVNTCPMQSSSLKLQRSVTKYFRSPQLNCAYPVFAVNVGF